MKKLFILLAFITVVATVNAQSPSAKLWKSSNGYTNDTLTNSETAYYTVSELSSYNQSLTFGILCTQLTGTSAGTVILQSSIDNTNWTTVNQTNNTSLVVSTNDTLTITSTAYNTWTLATTPKTYYRLKVGQTGTSTTKYPCYVLIKKY